MRIYPEKNIDNDASLREEKQKAIDIITHKVAVYFTLAIVVFFFFKMLVP